MINEQARQTQASQPSEKSAVATLLLCIFLGNLGIHRFYVGKWGTGILMLLTFGGLGIWYLIDIALIVCNRFRDADGRVIDLSKNPPSFKKILTILLVFIAICYGAIISSAVIAIVATGALVHVALDQLSALRTGDTQTAYSYTSPDFQKKTSFETFSSFVRQYRLDTNEAVSLYDRRMNGDNGYAAGTLRLQDGTMYMIQYRLHKEGDQWKVTEIGIGYGPKNAPQAAGTNAPQAIGKNAPQAVQQKPK